MNINELWNEIKNNCDKTIYTKNKLPFTYTVVDDNKIKINRPGKNVGCVLKSDLKFIIDNPNELRCVYRDAMRTASYALALYNAFYK